jgi:molybdenum cofactor cytidylyltransferase
MNQSRYAVVLAAGTGQRFRALAGPDQDKLLAPCKGLDGQLRPVLEQVLRTLCPLTAHCLVVTRHDTPQRTALAHAYGCQVVLIDSAGMGDSLAAAVRACPDADGWLVVLGDMPYIEGGTYRTLLEGISESRIRVPLGQRGRGHPVGFGRVFAQDLQALEGDQGGKRLLTVENVDEIAIDDPGIYQDVDQPGDLLI